MYKYKQIDYMDMKKSALRFLEYGYIKMMVILSHLI